MRSIASRRPRSASAISIFSSITISAFPKKSLPGLWGLKFFTRLTCIGAKKKLALSFHAMDEDEKEDIRVVPPLLRKEVFRCECSEGDYVHGYMVNSGFAESVREWHALHPDGAPPLLLGQTG